MNRIVTIIIILFITFSCKNKEDAKQRKDNYPISNIKEEKISIYPKKDTIFLGFRFGMSTKEFNQHLTQLISNGKIKNQNSNLIYSLNFKEQVVTNISAKSGFEYETKSFSNDALLNEKFGNDKLYELKLNFKTTGTSSDWNSKVFSYLNKILSKDYGKPKELEINNNQYKKEYPQDFKKMNTWLFSNSIKIVLTGGFTYIKQDKPGPLLIKERHVELLYLNQNLKQSNIIMERENLENDNKETNNDF